MAVTVSGIQSKSSRHTKKNRNEDPCFRDKNSWRLTLTTRILKSAGKDFEAVTVSMLNDIRKNMLLMTETGMPAAK